MIDWSEVTLHVNYFHERPGTSKRKFIQKAAELAEFSDCPKRHGCVVVRSGVIVGRGWNKHRNSVNILAPEHILTGSSVHAERMALKAAGENAKGADIYVVRIGVRGDLLLSRPCNLCYAEIIKSGVTEIYHT